MFPITVLVWDADPATGLLGPERVAYDGPAGDAADAAVTAAQDAFRTGSVAHFQVVTHRFAHPGGVCACLSR